MIPGLDDVLKMHAEGYIQMEQVASYIVKYVALEGDRADFAVLPAALRQEVIQAIDSYRRSRLWLVVSSAGTENYGPYAERFLEKVGRDLTL